MASLAPVVFTRSFLDKKANKRLIITHYHAAKTYIHLRFPSVLIYQNGQANWYK